MSRREAGNRQHASLHCGLHRHVAGDELAAGLGLAKLESALQLASVLLSISINVQSHLKHPLAHPVCNCLYKSMAVMIMAIMHQ